MDATLYNILALIVIVLPAFSIFAAYKLWKFSRSPEGMGVSALRERADTAIILALSSQIGGILGISRFTSLFFGFSLTQGIIGFFAIAAVVIFTSIPNMIWLYKYWTHGFRDTGDREEGE